MLFFPQWKDLGTTSKQRHLKQVRHALILLDRSLRGVAANTAFCRYFALSCDQIVGVELPNIVGRALFADTVAPLLNRGLAGEESTAEFLFSAADEVPRSSHDQVPPPVPERRFG